MEVSKACCGINSQDFGESLSSFWARIDGFRDSIFFNELKPKGGLCRAWTVRGTMHTFPSKDYYAHVFGSGRSRTLGRYENWAKKLGMPSLGVRIESLYQPLLDQIKGKSVTSAYVKMYMIERLAKLGLKSTMRLRRGWSSKPTYGPAWTGITEMSYLGFLVGAGRKGSESLWMRTSDWLDFGKRTPDPWYCTVELVRGYIQQYGPVTRSDIAYWNDRLFSDELDRVIEALRGDLVEERFEGSNETFYSFGGSSDQFAEPPDAVILPEFDSLMMGYQDRSRFLPRENLKAVSKSQGMISRTILVDGFVAATWAKRKAQGVMEVSVTPFKGLNARERSSIKERFADYGEYLGVDIPVSFLRKA